MRTILTWEATTTGWQRFNIDPIIVATGTVMDLVAVVRYVTEAPITWSGDWNYLTPNNAGTPATG